MDAHLSTFTREQCPHEGFRSARRTVRAAGRPPALFVLRFDNEEAGSMIVVAFSAITTQPIGRRSDYWHLMTALARDGGLPHASTRLRPTWHRAERAQSARDVVAGPHVGLQASSRSAAAGQDVGARAGAPRAGPLRCFELAAADLGTATLALVETSNFDFLGTFAFTRHENSISIVIAEVEFFAFGFFRRRSRCCSTTENLRPRGDPS